VENQYWCTSNMKDARGDLIDSRTLVDPQSELIILIIQVDNKQ